MQSAQKGWYQPTNPTHSIILSSSFPPSLSSHQTGVTPPISGNHSALPPKPTPPNTTNPLPPSLQYSHFIDEAMRDKMERFSIFPFSAGCVSQSSVAVGKAEAEPSPAPSVSQSGGKMKSSFGLLPLPRPNIAAGIQRVIKSLKSLSSIFVFYKEDDEEIEMEIGFPTDVQHVAHIGWDGMSSGNSLKSWDRGPELLSLPSLSLRQFELAMAAQAKVPQAHGPL